MGDRWVRHHTCQGEQRGLRGINAQEGTELLQAIKQGFQQGTHGIKAVVIEQRSHALPQATLAAHLRPHGLEQGTAQLLGLVDQKRQHHHQGKHHREILRAMTVSVLEVVALVFRNYLVATT